MTLTQTLTLALALALTRYVHLLSMLVQVACVVNAIVQAVYIPIPL